MTHGFDQFEAQFADSDVSTPITPMVAMRRMIWNVVPCDLASQVIERIGLEAASPDVEAVEHEAAHQRLANLGPIIGAVLFQFSGQAALAQVAAITERIGFEPDLEVEDLHPLVLQATASILAELLDIGLIKHGDIPVTVVGDLNG